ncbi:hypothetical protein GCM10025777_27050 [Membranihabitans marinus]
MVIIFSCNKEVDLSDLEHKPINYQEFFEQVANMDIKSNSSDIIYLNYEWNSKTNTIKLLSSEEREPDFFILESEKDIIDLRMANKYKVYCDNGDSSWGDECNDRWECGILIKKCLDEGGCAGICNKKMAFAPRDSSFNCVFV